MPLILNGTTGVSGVDGSAGTPSYQGTDTNTGIFYPAADTIAFAEGGTEVMRIDSSGNLLIGTAAALGSERLAILRSNAGEMIRWTDGTLGGYIGTSAAGTRLDSGTALTFGTGGNERMRIDSSGNVGIGTSSPSGRLDVVTGNNFNTRFFNNSAGNTDIYINTSAVARDFLLTRRSNGEGWLYMSGADPIAIYTNATERMRIDSSGNVGIGVTSYAGSGSLAVVKGAVDGLSGTAYRTASFYSTTAANADQPGIVLGFDTAGAGIVAARTNATGQPLAFWTYNGSAWGERMRILSTGEVLVNTTSQNGGVKLMSNNGANGWPATSGTTQTNGCLRIRGGDNAVLDFGVNSVNTWIQATDLSALNSIYWLFLNPNGGEVIVAGKTDNGAYNLQCNGTGVWGAGAYVNGSDERIKDNIAPLDSGLDVVTKLNPVTYKYKEDWSKDQSTQTGFIAQELLTALEGKNYVNGVVQQGDENQYMSVAYQNIIPILTKAIQEQQAMIEELKQEVAKLKGV